MQYYITILCSIFNSNKLMTYLFWSTTKTIHCGRCLWLIYIKSIRSISYVVGFFFILRTMVSWLRAFIYCAIVLSMFMLSFIFVIVCGLFGMEANLWRFYLLKYVLPLEIQLFRGEGLTWVHSRFLVELVLLNL